MPEGWEVETGRWTAGVDGLVGRIAEDRAAAFWCLREFPDEVALVLDAEGMPGYGRDANAFFRAAGCIYPRGEQECSAWVVGTSGWYVHDHGLEHHPHGPTWRVPGSPLPGGDALQVVAGSVAGRVFLWKDGALLMDHPDPTLACLGRHRRVGLGTWNSAVRFHRLRVYDVQACWQPS